MPKNIKRDKFLKYGNIRLENALTSIHRLANLSNKRAYEYDKSDVDKIIKSLKDEIAILDSKFKQAMSDKKGQTNILK